MLYRIESGALPPGEVLVCFLGEEGEVLGREVRTADTSILEGTAPPNACEVKATPVGHRQGDLWVQGHLRWWFAEEKPEGDEGRVKRWLAAVRQIF